MRKTKLTRRQFAGRTAAASATARAAPFVRHLQGEPMDKTLAWAESEVEGVLRT